MLCEQQYSCKTLALSSLNLPFWPVEEYITSHLGGGRGGGGGGGAM